jgi:ribonucleotide reductase alpha subunit
MKEWSNLAKVVYKRTYARNDFDKIENWEDTVNRTIQGNIRNHKVDKEEINKLRYLLLNRKATPAGRGLWFSGSPAHDRVGGKSLNNCWTTTAEEWENFIISQDLLMLGGGVGFSVEHRFTSKLPKVKKGVVITHQLTKDADFIIPDSREGWNEMTKRVLKSYFLTGKSFTYSTICIRGAGEPIKGFGGKASGPGIFVEFVNKLNLILQAREGKHIRPIDSADIMCAIGEMVVSGNVRRSAILILGDCWDKEYLKAKRWDLGVLPSYRAMANYSVVCDDTDDLHPLYWKTYEIGEPFGLVNRKNIQTYGRMGEKKKDTAYLVNPCAEMTGENMEGCNLQEIFLPNLKNEDEFVLSAKLMHRYGKRVSCEDFKHDGINEVVHRNRRIGTGITGCLQSSLFDSKVLNNVYDEIQKENISYSKELKIPESIRTTVIKPSGTMSLVGETSPGIHASFSKYYIRRVRFAANDDLIPLLKNAGHNMEPVMKLDGSLDYNTLVVDFYCETPEGTPCVDGGFDTWKQLDNVLFAQKYWADQSVSATIYYKKDEIPKIKEWLTNNLCNLKTISFLCYNDHGFKQAPLEAMVKEDYEKKSSKIKTIMDDKIVGGDLENLECAGGACPVK